MFRVGMGAIVLLLLTATLRSDDPKDKSSAEKPSAATQNYEALVKEYDDAYQEFVKAYRAAKTDDERNKAQKQWMPQVNRYSGKFLDLAKKFATDPAAVDALIWVANMDAGSKEASTALEALKKDHLDNPKIAEVCQSLAYQDFPETDPFLYAVLGKSKDHQAQGEACYALALHAKEHAEKASEKGEKDADKLTKDAEGLFERLAKDFADIKHGGQTLGDVAKGELYEMHFLAIGMAAPDIDGEDIDGGKMKLSDFKGKVVLLDFWGNW